MTYPVIVQTSKVVDDGEISYWCRLLTHRATFVFRRSRVVRKYREGVLFSVAEHLKDDIYFSEVVMLTAQNDSFGPTEISYLESKFINMAIDVDRDEVRYGNDPKPGNVTGEKNCRQENA